MFYYDHKSIVTLCAVVMSICLGLCSQVFAHYTPGNMSSNHCTPYQEISCGGQNYKCLYMGGGVNHFGWSGLATGWLGHSEECPCASQANSDPYRSDAATGFECRVAPLEAAICSYDKSASVPSSDCCTGGDGNCVDPANFTGSCQTVVK